MSWSVRFFPEAREDMRRLDGSQRILVLKAIKKVAGNPLSQEEGGYGKPLGNTQIAKLTGLLKIKLHNAGLRVVYLVEKTKQEMVIVIVAARSDDQVYIQAQRRINR